MDQPEYSRVILKMSGESFKGERDFGMDADTLKFISCQIKSIVDLGVEVGVVVAVSYTHLTLPTICSV